MAEGVVGHGRLLSVSLGAAGTVQRRQQRADTTGPPVQAPGPARYRWRRWHDRCRRRWEGANVDRALEDLIDRRAIDDLLFRYATALDTRQWDLLDQVFAPDATIEYSPSGG